MRYFISLVIGILVALGIYGQAMAEDNLATYWSFDEISGGVVLDATANNNDGSIGNATVVPGVVGQGLQFNGVDNYVYVPITGASSLDIAANESLTISVWIKTTATGDMVLFERIGSSCSYSYYMLAAMGNKALIGMRGQPLYGAEVWLPGTTNINDGKWHYIVSVRDVAQDQVYLYVDSKLESVTTDTTVGDLSCGDAYIGTHMIYSGLFFNGTMDEIAVYNSALTAAEIRQRYIEGQISLLVFGEVAPAGLSEAQVVSLIDATLAPIEADISTLQGNIANIQNSIANIQSDIVTIQGDVDNIVSTYNSHTHDKGSGGRDTSTPVPQVQE